MKTEVQVSAWQCICELADCPRKGKPWLSLATRPPSKCPTCRSREWDGAKQKRKPARKPRVDLPKPPKRRRRDDDTEF
jgi:hypothetical protein